VRILGINLRYMDSVKGAIIAFIIFIMAAIYIPGVGPSTEVENILTISTFLFAILAGFFIARLSTRYNEVRRLVGELDALFLSFYKSCQIYGEKFTNKIRELIDKFYIIAYDTPAAGESYKPCSKYYLQMWDEIIRLKKHKSESSYQTICQQLTDIEKVRNVSSVVHEEKLGYGQWLILIFLGGIILFSIFYLKTDALYSRVIAVLLSTVLILVLLIVRDLQNLMLGGKLLLEESGEEVFEFIGKPRYYNKYMIKRGFCFISKNIKEYRLGLHKPGSEKPDIQLIKR